MAELRLRKLVRDVQQNRAVAAVAERWVKLAKSPDQAGLAVEIDGVLAGSGFNLIDADRAAVLALAGEIAHLSPFQRFLERADALGGACGIEDQLAQRQQFGSERSWTGVECRRDRGIGFVRAVQSRLPLFDWFSR